MKAYLTKIMNTEEKYGKKFDEDPISIQTLSPTLLKPNFYELPIVKMRISRAGV